jgi:DUF4097 and DUF4098 domain-containing protein YvlB
MTDRVVKVEVDGPPVIDVSITSGDVIVKSGDSRHVKVVLSGNSEIVEEAAIDVTPDSVSVRSASQKRTRRFFSRPMDVSITAPPGARVRVGIGAGDVRIRVDVEDADVSSGSGDIRIDRVTRDLRAKTASGDITVARCDREANVASASGDIRIDQVAEATLKSASGNIVVGTVDGVARARAASGNVKVRDFRGTELDVSTMSGDVFVGLASGRTVNASVKTLSGDFHNKVTPTSGERVGMMSLKISSFSGNVTLTSVK